MIKFHTSLPKAMKQGKFWIYIGSALGTLGATLGNDLHKIYCVAVGAVLGAFGASMDTPTPDVKPEDKPNDANIK